MNDYWVAINRDEAHISREREKARALRKSKWWQDRISEGKCHYCGKIFPEKELSMDHIVPVARGGKSTKGNCVVSCNSCNQEKSCLTPAEMIFKKLDEERRKQQQGDSNKGLI